MRKLIDILKDAPKLDDLSTVSEALIPEDDLLLETKRGGAQTIQFLSSLRDNPLVDKIVSLHGLGDGSTALIRMKDGTAIELQARSAEYGDYHQDIRKASQYKDRKDKKNAQKRQEQIDFHTKRGLELPWYLKDNA